MKRFFKQTLTKTFGAETTGITQVISVGTGFFLFVAFIILSLLTSLAAADDLAGNYYIFSERHAESSYLARYVKHGRSTRYVFLDDFDESLENERWTLENAGNGYYRIKGHSHSDTG